MSGDEAAHAQADYAPLAASACCEGLPVADAAMEFLKWEQSQTAGDCAEVPTVAETSILQEADRTAGEDRSRDYGHPLANHRRIADIWNVQLEKKLSAPLTPKDVAVLMIGLKLARLINSPNHHDSFVDIAGYVKCWDMMDQVGE